MSYVLFNKGEVVGVTTESPFTGTPKLKEFEGVTYDEAKDTRGFKSMGEAEAVAEKLTKITGERWIAFDNGDGLQRYGVMELPKVGDDVSYGFNGDYYPAGKITRITPSLRIYVSDEAKPDAHPRKHLVFFRRKQTSGWVMKGGTWGLVKGIHDERNPHF